MALKPDNDILAYESRYYMNETASPGVIVCVGSTTASGSQMDHTNHVATVKANSDGASPIGMLIDEVVDVDQTRTPANWHKRQTVKGNKVSIVTKGWLTTDKTVAATAGKRAVLASSGFITNETVSGSVVIQPIVGRFRTSRDEAGFASVFIDL